MASAGCTGEQIQKAAGLWAPQSLGPDSLFGKKRRACVSPGTLIADAATPWHRHVEAVKSTWPRNVSNDISNVFLVELYFDALQRLTREPPQLLSQSHHNAGRDVLIGLRGPVRQSAQQRELLVQMWPQACLHDGTVCF